MTEGSAPPGVPVDDDQATIGAAPQPQQPLGTILRGQYRIERVLGEGAFGRVYLAYDNRLRSNVAIKELRAERGETNPTTYEHYLDRFQREARAARVSQHPNIVTVYALDADEAGNFYLVMEYIDGTDLRHVLEGQGALPVDRAVSLATEVAQALEAVHENDIVHRDLKPANIMITKRGTAKLTDFGVAQVGHESNRTHIAIGHPGTPMYMSPEQRSGQEYLSGTSDLFSLGLILYEMLVGEPYARTQRALAEARPDLSPPLIGIVEKLTAPESRQRYQRAADVIADLRQITTAPARPDTASTMSVATVPPRPPVDAPPAPARPRRNRRGMIAAGSGVVVVALIAAIVAIALWRNPAITPTATALSRTQAPPSVAPTAGANVFTVADPQNLISFSYPQEWQPNADAISGTAPYSFTSTNPVGQFNLFIEDVKADETLDAYADSTLANLLSTGYKPGSKGKQPATLGGQDARLIDAIAPNTGGDLFYYYEYITIHGNHVWNLAFLSKLSETDTFHQRSDIVVNSFVFCPASGCARKNTAPKLPGGPAASGTPAPSRAASPAAAAGTLTVADAKYLIAFTYPREWQAQQLGSSLNTLYSFKSTSPVGNFQLLYDDVLPDTTLDKYVDTALTSLRADPNAKPGPKGRQKVAVAGQDARLIDVLIPMANRPLNSYVYQYLLLRDNRIWTLTFGTVEDQADAYKALSDGVVNSFAFCPATGCTQMNTAPTAARQASPPVAWSDADGRVSLQRPEDWKETTIAGSPTNAVEFDGPDGVKFSVQSDTQDGTAAEEIRALVDGSANDPKLTYTLEPAKDVTIGGEKGTFVGYTFVPKDNSGAPRSGGFWVVNHGGREYALIAANIGAHRGDVNAIIASVKFLK